MSKLIRVVIQGSVELKAKLDALEQERYTAGGLIRATLEQELKRVDSRSDATVRKPATK